MFSIHKLKADHSIIGLVPALISLFIAALLAIFIGKDAAFTFLALVFWGFCIYTFTVYRRTGNTYFMVPSLYLFFAGFVLYYHEPSYRGEGERIVSRMDNVRVGIFS